MAFTSQNQAATRRALPPQLQQQLAANPQFQQAQRAVSAGANQAPLSTGEFAARTLAGILGQVKSNKLEKQAKRTQAEQAATLADIISGRTGPRSVEGIVPQQVAPPINLPLGSTPITPLAKAVGGAGGVDRAISNIPTEFRTTPPAARPTDPSQQLQQIALGLSGGNIAGGPGTQMLANMLGGQVSGAADRDAAALVAKARAAQKAAANKNRLEVARIGATARRAATNKAPSGYRFARGGTMEVVPGGPADSRAAPAVDKAYVGAFNKAKGAFASDAKAHETALSVAQTLDPNYVPPGGLPEPEAQPEEEPSILDKIGGFFGGDEDGSGVIPEEIAGASEIARDQISQGATPAAVEAMLVERKYSPKEIAAIMGAVSAQ